MHKAHEKIKTRQWPWDLIQHVLAWMVGVLANHIDPTSSIESIRASVQSAVGVYLAAL
jgi:hypothetical protein